MARFQQYKKALGSDVYLTIITSSEDSANTSFKELWKCIVSFENTFSRFLVDSETTKINASAGYRTAISEEMHDLLELCKKLYEETEGLFNPLILPALNREGYIGSWPKVEKFNVKLDYSGYIESTNFNDVEIEQDYVTIPKDSAIDFGGIGKGYLLDKLANLAASLGIGNYWFSLGGDLIFRGKDEDLEPWKIGIQDAINPEDMIDEISIDSPSNIALATSGTTKRRGEDWHHIIDPRTSKSALTDILSASVITNNAARADVFAKCFVIIGSRDAKNLFNKLSLDKVYIQKLQGDVLLYNKQGNIYV